jgi:hypothetical protein
MQDFCAKGYTALTVSFFRIFFGTWKLRVLRDRSTVSRKCLCRGVLLPLAPRRAGPKNAEFQQAGTFFTYFGTATLAALLYYELQDPWVAAGWATLSLIAIGAAYALGRRDYLHHSFLLAVAVVFRMITYNFFQPNIQGATFWQSQQYYAGLPSRFCLLLCHCICPSRSIARVTGSSTLDSRPAQVFSSYPSGCAALIALESTRGQLTVNWGRKRSRLLFAVWVGERSFRLAGLGLLLV